MSTEDEKWAAATKAMAAVKDKVIALERERAVIFSALTRWDERPNLTKDPILKRDIRMLLERFNK